MELPNYTAGRPHCQSQHEHWLDPGRLRLYVWVALACQVLYFGVWTLRAYLLQAAGVIGPGGDFVVFWSAAHLTLEHGPAAPYDFDLLRSTELAAVPGLPLGDGVLPWLYPPTYMLCLLPFALLPYGAATLAFMCGGAAWYAWAMYRTLPWRRLWLAGVAFPGVAVTLASGQNGLWLAGCAGLAMTWLRTRPVLAGALLGLLTVKPHLAVMFPLALLCARAWQALAAMFVTATGLAAASMLAFGMEPFTEFIGNAAVVQAAVEQGATLPARMPTIFAAARTLTGSLGWAYAMHGCMAAAAVTAVVYAWARPSSFALRAAVLMTAALLIPAYLYDYDLVLLGFAIAWLSIHSYRIGWRVGEREVLVLLWLLPLSGALMGGLAAGKAIGINPTPIGLVLALAFGVWRIRLERTGRVSRDA
ncbi:DUF2029 domain-containing protein [Cupriavidus pinatubonensis]|uniref:glycosyltransferase family 87 protein n=1 Tax=Cupriavidus pinatubonensis TaxID=248026 RepID=UPI001C7309EB|nr:glycosyltransferase family 87 protein [Cupriavidus pinatubonensis]QYY30842.1 DUF2029 domain-containing protein [Cupriavidus pinatubonensis]